MHRQRRNLLGGVAAGAMFAGSTLARAAVRADDRAGQTGAVGNLRATLLAGAQVASRLTAQAAGFDYAPKRRNGIDNGDYALGDIDVRYRVGEAWRDVSTAYDRRPVAALPLRTGEFAAADLSPTLPPDLPLRIERRWSIEGAGLRLDFTVANRSAVPVIVGALGFAMPFDNVLTDRTLEQAHGEACFADPYVGLDGGYLQVTRLNGRGPVLLVLPGPGTPFETWMPIAHGVTDRGGARLLYDRLPRTQTSEGFYRWMVASRAFAEREWRGAEQWNAPSDFTLQPGQARRFSFRLILAPDIRAIERTLIAAGHPVAVGIPGYVVPTDLPADLFVRATRPVERVEVFPPGALAVGTAPPARGWARYRVTGVAWGRARLTLHHGDGTRQSVHYFVTKPLGQVTAELGRFLFGRQWHDDATDRFGRSPSIISYDRERDAPVLQDKRVWIAGLSDEGGAGSWLAAIAKQLDNPDPAEVAKFERFHVELIERHLQVTDGPLRDGVRKSLFWYDPARPQLYDPAIDWGTWASWKPAQARSVVRSFNYVHVAAAQWVLYRLARNRIGLVRAHGWRWYLERAARTARAMPRLAPDHAGFGQMEGDVFLAILADLRREGMTVEADGLEADMRARAARWRAEPFPFGSEMPWDSTGQEEVHAWMRHFSEEAKAALTREVILAYDPLIPHWGYNGCARRYWDFLYAGKTARIERQLHHYGSALNALPLFDAFRRNPQDLHLLRVAYGGLMGTLTNVDRDGFGSCAFHSDPDMMRWDAYSGDYGMGFFGHAFATASYLVDHPEFGWIAFGGAVEEHGGGVVLTPLDSARTRVFIAPAHLWLVLESGRFVSVRFDPASCAVDVRLAPRDAHTPVARLIVEGGGYIPAEPIGRERGAYHLPLTTSAMSLLLKRGPDITARQEG